jgi:LmbE family N-acetylglucosaminyl deacetylase
MKKFAIFFLLSVVLVLGIGFFVVRGQLQDDAIPLVHDFRGESVMFIFPHPDDEITCAGTLKILDNQGVTTTLITLTRGEAGESNGMVSKTDPLKRKSLLGEIRKKELLAAGRLLGIDHQEVLDFPDSGLRDIPRETIKETIRDRIAKYSPTILISYDDAVGLYGHIDHRLTARYVKEVFLEDRNESGFTVRKMYQVTLPGPMIRVALKISKFFQDNYPRDPSRGLPVPTMAIRITEVGKYKRDAMLLHESQRQTFDDMQPYFDKLPPAIYYRIFDREYFAAVN